MDKPITLNAASPITFPLFGGRALLEAAAGNDKIRKFRLLAYTGGNRNQAADILGIDRVSLWRRIKRYGLE